MFELLTFPCISNLTVIKFSNFSILGLVCVCKYLIVLCNWIVYLKIWFDLNCSSCVRNFFISFPCLFLFYIFIGSSKSLVAVFNVIQKANDSWTGALQNSISNWHYLLLNLRKILDKVKQNAWIEKYKKIVNLDQIVQKIAPKSRQ